MPYCKDFIILSDLQIKKDWKGISENIHITPTIVSTKCINILILIYIYRDNRITRSLFVE